MNAVGFRGWQILLNNFAVDRVGLDGFQIGVLQSVREIPGFLTFLVVFVLLLIRENKLMALSVLVLSLGTALTGFFPSLGGLLFTTFIMSLGFHYAETCSASLTLQYYAKEDAPTALAAFRSAAALATLFGGGLLFFLLNFFSLKINYLLLGGFAGIGALFSLKFLPRRAPPYRQQKKLILKKEYGLYYVLNFFSGARRQIFVVFALFLLVKKYAFSAREIAALIVLNNLIALVINPLIGKAVRRFGERKVLSLEYASLIFIFILYGTPQPKWGVALLYILDHIFFNFHIAIRTYLQKIALPEDITPSVSAGFAVNHISAVIIPVAGGWLWLQNWQWPFWAGALISLISLLIAQKIKLPAPTQKS